MKKTALKGLWLGICAFFLAVVFSILLERVLSIKMVAGFLEEGIKITIALRVAREATNREAVKSAGWIGAGFWLVETICFMSSWVVPIVRIPTLIGHILWPMIGVGITRKKNILVGMVTGGVLHQAFNTGVFALGWGSQWILWGLLLSLATLVASRTIQKRLSLT